MPRTPLVLAWLLGWILALSACTADMVTSQPATAPALVGSTAPIVDGTPTAETTGWQQVDTAMELRSMRLSAGETSGLVTVVRLDPRAYKISVKYDVQNAGYMGEWFEALEPIAIINGGYFDENGRPTALVIFDGIRRGESYDGFGGMVAINASGEFELRSLRDQPFDPNESLQQAMQSSPMLIQPGGELGDFEANQDRSRRSVIARDDTGRILLIASNSAQFTLRELAEGLQSSDLAIDAALNLDGGRSTGLFLDTPSAQVTIDSLEKLPLVLVVEARG